MKKKTAITPTREENYPIWYQNVIKASDLAEPSLVRGCMVIKPWGYSLWENISKILDSIFKKNGIKNAYFPIFIPLSLMKKEAKHVKGFAKECAVVTHNKLIQSDNMDLIPGGLLTEPLIVRPTSETIIGHSFSKWIESYKDLPLLINQWSNVVRWEMRTRMFLRTSEFLWQEGHTAHSSSQEAENKAKEMLLIYKKLVEDYLAIPVVSGKKSKSEQFPGAVFTLSIEAIMQDKKALQMGTSHFLGQNFSKAANIVFSNKYGKNELVWTTSWGVSTRLIGGLIMTHGDDNGIVMPPRIASAHIVFIPIFNTEDDEKTVMQYINLLLKKLENVFYFGRELVIEIDKNNTSSYRNWKWIKRGVPIRIEIGKKEVENQLICVKRRDKSYDYKVFVHKNKVVAKIKQILDKIHYNIFEKAKNFKKKHTTKVDSFSLLSKIFTSKCQKKNGGFVISYWCGDAACEDRIKKDLSVTIRCIPFKQNHKTGKCIICNKYSKKQILLAKSY